MQRGKHHDFTSMFDLVDCNIETEKGGDVANFVIHINIHIYTFIILQFGTKIATTNNFSQGFISEVHVGRHNFEHGSEQ